MIWLLTDWKKEICNPTSGKVKDGFMAIRIKVGEIMI